ncbi:VpsP family polysaccharide biosynthesis protein [Thalassotalea euphylliae]|uniref:Tetratricopeptide repeat protein n=1 Tax=Thalassotalea euphylliae TaxID=1655234 RepID=A0A3E0U736_9GAMM|nr:VpsP family polysaccharide biosynthesis protein [Thalassotalea euphylliae]REL31955.1 hypothetical protein DXX94_15195 [Thalassotalea euphylliae]
MISAWPRKAGLVVLSLLLLLMAWQAIQIGRANLSYLAAHNAAEYWRKEKLTPSQESLQSALMSAQKANSIDPNNPHYLLTEALIWEWQGITLNQIEDFSKAKLLYLEATQYRPTWPVTWATLAILKWRLNEFDEEMLYFLYQAERFGPNRKEVHEAWLEIGLHLYQQKHQYTAKLIKPIRKHLRAMLGSHDKEYHRSAVNIIERHQAQRLACSWIQYDVNLAEQFNTNFCS